MEVAIIAVGLGGIVLMVWLSKTLNRYSEERYFYTPISFSTSFLAMIPYILFIAGFFFFNENPDNQMMAIVFGGVSFVGLFWWIANHSSYKVALAAIFLLGIIGIFLLVILVVLSRGRDNHYYD